MPKMRVALVAGLALLGADAAAAESAKTPVAGDAAPDFTAANLMTHAPVKLSSEQGKLVFLTFWASWCPPCRQELPVLEGVQRRLGPERAVVLAVSFREKDDGLVRTWARKAGLQITLLQDSDGHVARQYGIDAIPHLFIIGPDGKILTVHTGYGEGSIDELVDDINAALRGIGAEPAASAAAP
jgi:peroxiredoxin